jgi:uncharacterized protein (TIGR03790 family)
MPRRLVLLGLALIGVGHAAAEGLSPERLAVIFNSRDKSSVRIAQYYALHRHIPSMNLIGLDVPDREVINRDELKRLRILLLAQLPSNVQSLLLVWSRPYSVECMSITTAVAAGYQPGFCEPGCEPTKSNPLYDTSGWLPADTTGWLPAMLLPSQDEKLAEAVIERGINADGSHPPGTLYLVRTQDPARNVRAAGYEDTQATLSSRLLVRELRTPVNSRHDDVIGYFTGAVQVEELPTLTFRPGAAADHLTSTGGVLGDSRQMSALEWLRHGATASYGSVSEPCNHVGKFPNPAILFDHYLRGDTLLEAYWKSVKMPGQGLFIGEPLAKPFESIASERPK